MEIDYKNNNLRKKCEQANKFYGLQAATIVQRLDQLYAATDLTDIQKIGPARLHQLEGQWKGCFAIDIKQPHRIIIEPVGNFSIEDYHTITKIKILAVNINYH